MNVNIRVATLCMAFATCSLAQADEVSDKVCPLIEKIAAELGQKADFAVQIEILTAIGSAYDMDGDKLRAIVGTLDASTTEACPDARTAVLERANVTSLQMALR